MSENGSAREQEPPRIVIESAGDVVAAVPYLLRFHPQSSIVVVGLRGTRVVFAARGDLPPLDTPVDRLRVAAAYLAAVVARQDADAAVVVGYGPADRVDRIFAELRPAFAALDVTLMERIRVTDGRYYSYDCTDPQCCPPSGGMVPQASVMAAHAVYAGVVALPNRAAVAAQVAAADEATLQAMAAAVARARQRVKGLLPATPPRDWPSGRAAFVAAARAAGLHAVDEALQRYERGGRLDDDEAAWLLVLLRRSDVRDGAMSASRPRAGHLRLWMDVTRRAPGDLVVAPACLLSFTAWRAGDGALARVALDRALALGSGERLPRLLAQLLDTAVPPSAWTDEESAAVDPDRDAGGPSAR